MQTIRSNWIRNKTKHFLLVLFHNVKSYDSHFVIKHFKKQYTARPKTTTDNDDNYHIDTDADETLNDDEEMQMVWWHPRDFAKRRKVSVLPSR